MERDVTTTVRGDGTLPLLVAPRLNTAKSLAPRNSDPEQGVLSGQNSQLVESPSLKAYPEAQTCDPFLGGGM